MFTNATTTSTAHKSISTSALTSSSSDFSTSYPTATPQSSAAGTSLTQTDLIIYGASGLAVILFLVLLISYLVKRYREDKAIKKFREANAYHGSSNTLMSLDMSITRRTFTPVAAGVPIEQFVEQMFQSGHPGVDIFQHQVQVSPIKKISAGGNGIIELGKFNDPALYVTADGNCVIKTLQLESMPAQLDPRKLFMQEVALMTCFRHLPVFAKLLAYTVEPMAMMVQYYPLGSLKNLIQGRVESPQLLGADFVWTLDLVIQLMCNLCDAINALHDANVAHCDIKPHNCLMYMHTVQEKKKPEKQLMTMLNDFGLSRLLNIRGQVTVTGGSPVYSAPEVLDRFHNKIRVENPDEIKAGDVYAFGCVVYECTTRQEMWQSDQGAEQKVMAGQRPNLSAMQFVFTMDAKMTALQNMIQACWIQDWQQRPQIAHLKRDLDALLKIGND